MTNTTVLILLCCCVFLFAYIHEQQKMTRSVTVLSSTINTATIVAGLEMPKLLQTQESEEEEKTNSWCDDKRVMVKPLH